MIPPVEQPEVRLSGVTRWIQPVVLVALATLFIGSLGEYDLFQPMDVHSVTGWAVLISATFAALAIHEAGHLAACRCCGFEVTAISFGMVQFSRAGGGWRFRLNPKRFFTGSVAAYPRTQKSWRRRMLTVVTAGPVATLAGACAAYLAFREIPPGWQFASHFAQALAQLSFAILLLSLIPSSSSSATQNDAGLFLALYRNSKLAEEISLYHLVLQHQRKGNHPREFPLWIINKMAVFQGRADLMAFYAGVIAIWAFSGGDRKIADEWDQRALELSLSGRPAIRHACLANSACFDLIFRQDPTSAKTKLAQIKFRDIGSLPLRHQALAARDLAAGRAKACINEIAKAQSVLAPPLRSRGFECFLLEHLQAAALSVH